MKKTVRKMLIMGFVILSLVNIRTKTVHATGEENPRVIVEEYQISDEEIIPGQQFDLTLKIRNTSQFYDVYSVVVTLTDKTGTIYPVYSQSNQLYVDCVYARNYTEVTIPMTASESITESVIPIDVTITYNDNYFIEKQSNSSITLYLPVKTAGSLNVVSCSVPETASIGTKARISVVFENTGLKSLNNIQLHVSAQDGTDMVTELYSMMGGSTNSSDVYLECLQQGDIPVKIYFTYQDDTGENFETDEQSYTVRVVEDVQDADSREVVVVGSRVDYVTFILLAAIIAVAFVILVTLRKRRK